MSKEQKPSMAKKVLGCAIAGLVGISAGIGGSIMLMPSPEPIVEYETVIVNNTVEVPFEIIKEVEVEKVIEVDNENLGLVLNTIFDKDGNVTYLTEGLLEDEVDQIVDRIVLVNEFELTAENLVKRSFARELAYKFSSDYDARDVQRLVIDSDATVASNINFMQKDANVSLKVEFRHDGKLYSADVAVEFVGGNSRPIVISNVVLK